MFEGSAIDGIACHEKDGWALRRTGTRTGDGSGEYRQAGAGDPALFAAAQDMMADGPLDAGAERAARARGWRE